MKVFFRTIVTCFFVLTIALNLFATTTQNEKENWVLLEGARLENKVVQKVFVVVDIDDNQLGVLLRTDKGNALYGTTTTPPIAAGSQFTLSLMSGEPLAGQTLTLTVNALRSQQSGTFVATTVNGFTGDQPTVQLQSISKPPKAPKTPYEQCTEACAEYTHGFDYLLCLEGCYLTH